MFLPPTPGTAGAAKLFAPPLHALQIGITAAESGGGGERYYFNLLRALPASDVSATGLVSGDPAALTGQSGVTSFAPDGTSLLARWPALRRSVRAALSGCDVAVSHFAPYAFAALDLVRRRPLVVHFHGSWALEGAYEGGGRAATSAKRAIERAVYSQASRFIVLSQASQAILEREYGVNPANIRLIPGGVDMRRFSDLRSRRDARAALGWPLDRPTIVTARRLVRSKGVENLIESLDAVRREVPDVLLLIAGSGPLAADLQRRVDDLDLDRHVRFLGQVGAELPTMYRAADLSIVPSVALEGFGLVVLEALACGTPTLVTPITGLPEVVADLDPGLVLDGCGAPEIARGLADALTGRFTPPSPEACIAHAARFDWPLIAARVADVYREVA